MASGYPTRWSGSLGGGSGGILAVTDVYPPINPPGVVLSSHIGREQ